MYLSLYCNGSKRVTQGFTARGSWRPNRTAIYWPPLLWPSALCLSRSPGLLNRRPRVPALCWLSLLHLITNWSPKLRRGPEGPFGRVWLSLPHHVSDVSDPQLSDFLSWPSYIVVQRPLNRPLNLWNGMFNHYQAKITVMQFRCHSLPVYQSMSVSWDFYLVPFRQPISAYAISFDYWPLGCVTSFRCITLEWHVWPGLRSKYNTRTNIFRRSSRVTVIVLVAICHRL